MPEANPDTGHRRAQRLAKVGWAWGALLTAWGVYLVGWHPVTWEMLTTAACLAVTVRCIDTLRRL